MSKSNVHIMNDIRRICLDYIYHYRASDDWKDSDAIPFDINVEHKDGKYYASVGKDGVVDEVIDASTMDELHDLATHYFLKSLIKDFENSMWRRDEPS